MRASHPGDKGTVRMSANGELVWGFNAKSGERGRAYINTGDNVAGLDNTQSWVEIVAPEPPSGGDDGSDNPNY